MLKIGVHKGCVRIESTLDWKLKKVATQMLKCFICDRNIEELSQKDRYEEHIILNAIGGKLTSEDLLCQQCAPEFDKIDAALAESLNTFGGLLNIDRDRKKNPGIPAIRSGTQDKFYLNNKGSGVEAIPAETKPTVEDNLTDSKNPSLHLAKISSKKQFRKILNNLKSKINISQSNIDEIILNLVFKEVELDAWIKIKTLDNDKCFRSVCKMAINYYIFHGGDPCFIKHLIPYIKNETEGNFVWYYYPDPPVHKDNRDIVHTLFIHGNPQEKILYAYIEFFNVYNLIILLSDCYTGNFIQESYSYDLISRSRIIDFKLNLNLSKSDILHLFKSRPQPTKENIIKVIDSKDITPELKNLKEIFDEILQNHFTQNLENNLSNEESDMELSSILAKIFTDSLNPNPDQEEVELLRTLLPYLLSYNTTH